MQAYAPLNVLKPIGKDIWLVDGPAIRFYGIGFTTRMVVIRLVNGDLFLHSPTLPEPGLTAEISKLGVVKHLIAPSWLHYAYVDKWAQLFPDALCHSAEGVMERARKMKVPMRSDAILSGEAPAAWAGQINQIQASSGATFNEVLFFHEASKTLIFTDFFENMPKENLPLWFRPFAALLGIIAPKGGMPRDMRLTYRAQHAQLRQIVNTLISWQPKQIVFAHGDWYQSDGVAHLKKAFDWLL